MNEICTELLSLGWKEFPDQFKSYARCFAKHYDTPTPCALNEGRGIQVCLDVSELRGVPSIEMDMAGELKDGTWLKITNYVLPKELPLVLPTIPRLLAAWEAASLHSKPANNT